MSFPVLPAALAARDGLQLHLRHWPVAQPRGVVQYLHGLCEHAGRYPHLIRELNAAGWAVAAIDHRGHGRSAGVRGALVRDDDLLWDQATLRDALAPAYAGLPWVLMGSSMGGLLAARIAAAQADPRERAPWVRAPDAVVMSAPALQPHMTITQRALLSSFGRLAPDLNVPVGLKPEWASSNPEVIASFDTDPDLHQRITPRLTLWMLDAGRTVFERAPGWTVPTLMLYSRIDKLVDWRACARFAQAVPQQLVEAHAYEDLAHDLLNELQWAQPVGAVTGWLARRFG
jgi:alpha-beta hydrolase superfamily lysophospholipase